MPWKEWLTAPYKITTQKKLQMFVPVLGSEPQFSRTDSGPANHWAMPIWKFMQVVLWLAFVWGWVCIFGLGIIYFIVWQNYTYIGLDCLSRTNSSVNQFFHYYFNFQGGWAIPIQKNYGMENFWKYFWLKDSERLSSSFEAPFLFTFEQASQRWTQ